MEEKLYYNQNYKKIQNYAIYGYYNEMFSTNTHKSVCMQVHRRS